MKCRGDLCIIYIYIYIYIHNITNIIYIIYVNIRLDWCMTYIEYIKYDKINTDDVYMNIDYIYMNIINIIHV